MEVACRGAWVDSLDMVEVECRGVWVDPKARVEVECKGAWVDPLVMVVAWVGLLDMVGVSEATLVKMVVWVVEWEAWACRGSTDTIRGVVAWGLALKAEGTITSRPMQLFWACFGKSCAFAVFSVLVDSMVVACAF